MSTIKGTFQRPSYRNTVTLWSKSLFLFFVLLIPPVLSDTPGDREKNRETDTPRGQRWTSARPVSEHDLPGDSWARIQQEIRESEYEITWQERTYLSDTEASWQAPNRAHGFRIYFTEKGIRVIPRTESEPSWEWGLALAGYGRAEHVWAVAPAELVPEKNRIEYARQGMTEWYLNDLEGLEQGFKLNVPPEEIGPPSGSDDSASPPGFRRPRDVYDHEPVYLVLSLTGSLSPEISEDGQAISFRGPDGRRRVLYSELAVSDSLGEQLPAWMEGFAEAGMRGVRLVVDDRKAVYPVTVDSLATDPSSVLPGYEYVAAAGDVNGDGYSDIIVGDPRFDGGLTDEGKVLIFFGNDQGDPADSWSAEGEQAGAQFGLSFGTAGDLNGDGYADVIIGAPYYGLSSEGAAFVWYGSPSMPSTSPPVAARDADWTAQSDWVDSQMGFGYPRPET
jgi:hypothetical protein